jgi:hypothetical protein
LDNDLDMVVGWRKKRKDNVVLRKMPSTIANWLIGHITGVRLHDYGCSLKVYRTELIRTLRLYGEMHRFIPAWVATSTQSDRIGEQVVNHFPRRRGKSKYGLSRTFRVALDLLAMYFFMRFSGRPGLFFGLLGWLTGSLGFLALGYLAILKVMGESIGTRPLLFLGVFLVLMSVQFVLTGIQTEILSRIYFGMQSNRAYVMRPGTDERIEPDAAWNMFLEVENTISPRIAEISRANENA